MTFDQLCKSILEEAPGITMPVVPKMNLSAPGGKQLINAPQTSVKPQYSGTEAATDNSQNTQPSEIDNTDNSQNTQPSEIDKQIKDLQTMVTSLSDALRKSQGLPPGPKKPTFTSASINPQP